MNVKNEPVGLVGAINTALLATWSGIVLIADLDSTASGVGTAIVGAWIAVATILVRGKVTPA